MNTTKIQPNRSALSFNDDFFRSFDRFFPQGVFAPAGENVNERVWTPRVDVSETESSYFVYAELPGIQKEAIKVNIDNNVLTLEGERKSETKEEGKNWHRQERSYGKFYRAFRLPTTINRDGIQASFKDGVLELNIPKAEEARPREIEIHVN